MATKRRRRQTVAYWNDYYPPPAASRKRNGVTWKRLPDSESGSGSGALGGVALAVIVGGLGYLAYQRSKQ